MSGIETNIFPLKNLDQLSSRYKLYKVRGLSQGTGKNRDEIYRRINSLVTKLSYSLRIPVTSIESDGDFHVVVRDDANNLPEHIDVVRTRLFLDPVSEVFNLDYRKRTPNNDRICIKFLQFLLREPLNRDKRLWSPNTGRPFFELEAALVDDKFLRYTGFIPKVVVTHNGGLGVCVDVTHKYISKDALPPYMTRQQFSRVKGRHFVYRFGNDWYEIKADHLDDLNVSEATVDTGSGLVKLIDFIYSKTEEPFSEDLLNLPTDANVVRYYNNRGELRSAPLALCYQVYGSHDWVTKKYHHESILPPIKRRTLIRKYVREHLENLRFGDTNLKISNEPLNVPARKFLVPDLEFGNGQVLSVRGTNGSRHVSLDNLGETRLSMLKDGPGFFDSRPLDYHYLILPWSVYHSYGRKFRDELVSTVDKLFPQEDGFNPKLIFYDDRGDNIWPEQAAEIRKAVEKSGARPGYAVVMIHMTEERRLRDEDTLAAAVFKELCEFEIYSTVIHTKFTKNCYKRVFGQDGRPTYVARDPMRLSGYLQGVAINKILLNDFRAPFRLSTNLHADLTIGIDVKNHTAGFVVIGKKGEDVRFDFDTDQVEKEKISFKRMKKCFKKILREEIDAKQDGITQIVIHRDGKLYQSEIDAIEEVIEEYRRLNLLSVDLKPTFLEIRKNSEIPFRIFEVIKQDYGEDKIWNPQVGYYYIQNQHNGYICSTGRAFFSKRKGTVNPLHVKYIKGGLGFEECLEDVYFFTTLTWTNPRDCSREPISIKMTDRYLEEEAGLYNRNELSIVAELTREVGV